VTASRFPPTNLGFVSTKSAEELCALAQELEQDAARYPDERGEILLEAAHQWESAGQVDQAVALLREVLTLGGEDAGFARYSLAELCFKQSADSDAWEHLRALDEMGPTSTGPAALVGELLEERGEYEAAAHWFDRAIETVDLEAIAKPGAGPSLAAMPLFGRQRCRAKLGLPVDEVDRVADSAREQGRVHSWPPGRNQMCWCGSERKYKKCCGAPATAR